MNPEVRLGIDMRTPAEDEPCDLLAGDYASCADIHGTLSEGEDFAAVVVLYTFQAVQAVQYMMMWLPDWTVYEFESCSDLLMGGHIGECPMFVGQSWTEPVASEGGTSGIPLGVLRGSAVSAGCVYLLSTTAGGIPVVDPHFGIDYAVEKFKGCVGMPSPGDPCAFDSVLIADLWAENSTGPHPLEVTFHDASLGGATSWFWTFGDGAMSTLRSPIHTYEACGVYTVSLEVMNESATDDTVAPGFVWSQTALVPDFAGEPRSGCRPLEVRFTDLTAGGPTSRLWEFGDGATSTEANPVHVYADSGLYPVTLTVADACSTLVLARPGYVAVPGPPEALFTASPIEGCSLVVAHFTDLSAGPPMSWFWTFGDGGISTQQNPTHGYTRPGSYTVTLTVTNACDTSSYTLPTPITVAVPVTADFTAEPASGCVPLGVQFTDLTPGPLSAWSWDFGDGETGTEPSPFHVYQEAGVYTVGLAVTNECGTYSVERDSLVRVEGSPAAFSADVTAGCTPFEVHFTDLSDPAATVWTWDFGDGGTSTERNPAHTYTTQGLYDVSLQVTAPCGTTGVTREDFIRADSPGSFHCRDVSVAWIDFAGASPSPGAVDLAFGVPPGSGPVEIQVYDARGRKVRELLSGVRTGGTYPARWNGDDDAGRSVPAGVYFIRLETPARTVTKKVLLYR